VGGGSSLRFTVTKTVIVEVLFRVFGFPIREPEIVWLYILLPLAKVNHGLDKYDDVLVLLRALLLPLLLRDMILLC
jgi:hypothetical protein